MHTALATRRVVRMRTLLPAGFSEAKVTRDADISAPPLSGLAGLQAKFNWLLGGSSQGDPFYAVLAYKES